jgi:hypothetical protein
MPALVAGIHVSGLLDTRMWIAGTSPAMTSNQFQAALI